MMNLLPILAELPLTPQTSKIPKWLASDFFLILAASLLIFGVLIAWIIWIRGPKSDLSPARRVYKGSHHIAETPSTSPPRAETEEERIQRIRKKKRTRRRDHRSRNPTLSETGGLPPPRGPETQQIL